MRDRFRRAGIDTPELDARLLAELAFGLGRLALAQREREPAGQPGLARLQDLAARRLRGEPIARIIGEKEFWSLGFALNESTLVPRPETELLVQKGRERLAGRPRPRLLDLGTGSGCIAIALLHELPEATGVAVDLAEGAVSAARANAERHNVASRLAVMSGSWFEPLQEGEVFGLIVANPPYIDEAAIWSLAAEVRDHDPLLALDGGADGLAAYRLIVAEAPRYLEAGGSLLVEIGAGQARAVELLFRAAGFRGVATEKDLAGLDRMVMGHHL